MLYLILIMYTRIYYLKTVKDKVLMVRVITLHKSLGRGYANGSAICTRLEIAGQRILPISESQTRIQDRSINVYTQIKSGRQRHRPDLELYVSILSEEALIVQMDEETKTLLRNIAHHLKWVIALLLTILGLLITQSLD